MAGIARVAYQSLPVLAQGQPYNDFTVECVVGPEQAQDLDF